MENNDEPTWEDIDKLKRKINYLEHMDRQDPEFKKLLKIIEQELEIMTINSIQKKDK